MKLPVLALALLVAGCVGPATLPPVADEPAVALRMDGRTAVAGAALPWNGAPLVYSPADERRCGPSNCEVKTFHLAALPEGEWTLQVALDWAPSHDANTGDNDPYYPSFNMTVRGPGGYHAFHPGMKFGNLVVVDAPKVGDYEVEVRITHMIRDWNMPYIIGGTTPVDPIVAPASGSYTGALLLRPRTDANAGQLLPDLIVRDLGGLRIEYSAPGQGHGYSPDGWLPTTKGCTAGENQESGATRCLRFSIGIGNDGEGPLALSALSAVDPLARTQEDLGLSQQPAVQCISYGAGNGTVREAGTATWSASHRHTHFDDILGYALFAFEFTGHDNGTRGEQVATGTKLGYGPWPEALVHDGAGPAWKAGVENACDMAWHVGLNPGWYDYYLWWRTGQFIDVADVPDGVYELVTTINPVGNVLELDATNNEGSLVFRLTGDRIDVLRPFVFGDGRAA